MSTDSQSTQNTQTSFSLAQLWQIFSGGGADIANAIAEGGASNFNSAAGTIISNNGLGSMINGAGGDTSYTNNIIGSSVNNQQIFQQQQQQQQATNNSNSNNNNYVNFNQFIMQHNLLGAGGGSGGNVERSNASVTSSSAPAFNGNIRDIGGDGGGGYMHFAQTSGNNENSSSNVMDNFQQQTNYINQNSNIFSYNDLYATPIANNGTNNYNNTTTTTTGLNNFYDNVYTPFGNTGTAYFANPFATGFDFNASNLQATAPEFVPRFNNLTLDENINKINGNATTAKTTTNKTATQHQQQQQQPQQQLKDNLNFEQFLNNSEVTIAAATSIEDKNNIGSGGGGGGGSSGVTTAANFIMNNGGEKLQATAAQHTKSQQKYRNNNENNKQQRYNGGSGGGAGGDRDNMPLKSGSWRSNNDNNTSSSSYNSPSNNGGGSGMGRSTGATSRTSTRSDSRSSTNGFSNNNNSYAGGNHGGSAAYNNSNNNVGSGGGGIGVGGEKSSSARAERERERDNRRYQNGRRSVDYNRSNKRRDDWNRNRDRVNGFRVEEKYSTDNGKDSPLPSPEKKPSPKKIYPENEKLSQREKLIRDIEIRRLECLVCVEPIKFHHSAWSCNNCYHILHLQCIIKWASSSKSDDGWRCPACQNVVKEVPRDYYCFCGKVKNPSYNRQDIAHSCGDVCGRVEGCAHACTLLCHPGPCPPCQANVKRECGCGKTTKVMQCCLKETIECDSICEKLLNCELHKCSAKCHDGKCTPCAEKVDQTCHCSKQERQVACTRDSHDKHIYSCGKPCGKDLSCGNHKCKDCCHAGECRTCKLSPEAVTSCPCGKMPVVEGQRSSCLDAIPVCEGVCGKTLRCGKAAHPHHCTSKCHLGNCPPCNKQTAVKCRCGHMDQMIKCRQLSTRADDARCKKRCVKKRSCGKHKCNQECCIDIDHICPLPCNYTLSCGKHKCDQPCHRGNCPPCYRSSFEELYCECGAEVIYPPVPCGTKKPICKRHCSRQHPCNHTPQHNCHSAATCPPCMMFTTKWCFGQHEQRKTIPCSQESFSCGLACNKPLPCGRHKCIKSCHEGACSAAGEVCKQSCTTLRAACGHKCMAPCHDAECPETPCKEMVEVQCDCGNRKQQRSCHDLAREYSRIATAQLASSMAEMQRGNYMELSEILAPVKMNKTNKTLDCNDECRLLERNRRLAIGLQIRNPDLPQKLMTKYSDFIRNFVKRDPALVKSIHDALTNLVKLAKESKQKSRSHSFPTMNREKRQLVHEMCEMFGVESVAYDAEPNRNVVATAYKDRSWLPATSILEVMQREAGQRRVPVPSNNAWGIKR